MKIISKLIFIFFFFISINFSYAQCIIPLEEYWDTPKDSLTQNECYVKDINNILDKYIGNWNGTYENVQYEFTIKKAVDDNVFNHFKMDILIAKYIIKNEDGSIIEDTTSLLDFDLLNIIGLFPSESNDHYLLDYFGKKKDCGRQSGTIYLNVIEEEVNKNDNEKDDVPITMKISSISKSYLLNNDCEVKPFIPNNSLILTKQEELKR